MRPIPGLKNNPDQQGQYLLRPDVTYAVADGLELKMTLILPWVMREKRPLVVFVQGSAWTTPDFCYELPQLCLLAREGFVVATVGHRDCSKGHPFPAYLQDVKRAIRFLRAHSEEYGIDPERVGIWGTSSGGNTALLVGLTADDARYKTEDNALLSDGVKSVVSCFGPTDMVALSARFTKEGEVSEMGAALAGSREPEEVGRVLREMSPVYHTRPDAAYPSFLLLNGTADIVVPHSQMEAMYDRLVECGAKVSAYYVESAEHEGNFWTPEVRQVIFDFLKDTI